MDESLASNKICVDTKFMYIGIMVIELRVFNQKIKKKKKNMSKMRKYFGLKVVIYLVHRLLLTCSVL